MKQYICLDIGGTYLKYGILTSGGRFLVKRKVPTHAEQGGAAVLAQAKGIVVEYREKSHWTESVFPRQVWWIQSRVQLCTRRMLYRIMPGFR